MSTQTQKASDEYLRMRVMTASPEELRLMLLDGAIRFATQGLEAIERSDVDGAIGGISQARAIVCELLTTIRDEPDPELADRVRSVYAYMYRELMALGVDRDAGRLREILGVLGYERETWVLLMDKLAAERGGRQVAGEGERAERKSLSFEA